MGDIRYTVMKAIKLMHMSLINPFWSIKIMKSLIQIINNKKIANKLKIKLLINKYINKTSIFLKTIRIHQIIPKSFNHLISLINIINSSNHFSKT